jgi:hypothetical protein
MEYNKTVNKDSTMSAENVRTYSPPYISPRTFQHLIEQLQTTIPDRFDRSYLDSMFSGSTGVQVMAAMRFLNLLDSGNKPTHHLRLLVQSTGEERTKRLRDLANNVFGFILNNESFNIQTATYGQLEEIFTSYFKVDGDVRRKCIKFFISLAQDADIKLSPHITKKVKMTSNTAAVVRTSTKKTVVKAPKIPEIPQIVEKVPENTELIHRLISKFPDYDIQWTDVQKQKWVDDFTLFFVKVYPEVKK